jgi:hypothetical protein
MPLVFHVQNTLSSMVAFCVNAAFSLFRRSRCTQSSFSLILETMFFPGFPEEKGRSVVHSCARGEANEHQKEHKEHKGKRKTFAYMEMTLQV